MKRDERLIYRAAPFTAICKCGVDMDLPWITTGTDRDDRLKALVTFKFSCPACGDTVAETKTFNLNAHVAPPLDPVNVRP